MMKSILALPINAKPLPFWLTKVLPPYYPASRQSFIIKLPC
jgi:hypothetical protein